MVEGMTKRAITAAIVANELQEVRATASAAARSYVIELGRMEHDVALVAATLVTERRNAASATSALAAAAAQAQAQLTATSRRAGELISKAEAAERKVAVEARRPCEQLLSIVHEL